MLPERERPFALSHGVAGMSAMSPPSQQTWKRNSSLARGLDRGLRGCVSAGAPAWPGRGSPLQSWRQARSAKVTRGPQTGSRGKTFLLVVPCHPHPSHPVTEGAFGHQDQVMSRTHTLNLSVASVDPGIKSKTPATVHTARGPGGAWLRDLYYPPSTHAVHFCLKQWFSLGKRGLRGG